MFHRDIRQILGYLKKSGLEVGLLAGFASEGLKIKRLLRGYQGNPGKSESDSGILLYPGISGIIKIQR
jgi:hypothetical protein